MDGSMDGEGAAVERARTHAKVLSAGIQGVEAIAVEIEVDIGRGLPGVILLGLPDAGMKEGRDRIRPAIRNSGYDFPNRHVTANLAPAHVRKEGAVFDLPLAIGVLAASGQLPPAAREALGRYALVGELALDGRVRPARGALSMAMAARSTGRLGIILPRENAPEAAVVEGLEAIGVSTIREAVGVLAGEPGCGWRAAPAPPVPAPEVEEGLDFADVRGVDAAKEAVLVAAAGGHNLLLAGPPGAGKTMLARRVPTILPPLDFEASIEVTRIASVAGLLPPHGGLVRAPPFRAPHHTASEVALVGGGSPPRPGEATLAHRGVLFLDELPEFGTHKLDTLRQPMEEGVVRIARASGTIELPAEFMCIAAMNPCPCGLALVEARECKCTAAVRRRYQARVSGPLRDRFDVQVVVRPASSREGESSRVERSSAEMRAAVLRARRAQDARRPKTGTRCNARLPGAALRRAGIGPDAERAARSIGEMRKDSARGIVKLLRLARTVADLAGDERVTGDHVLSAAPLRDQCFEPDGELAEARGR